MITKVALVLITALFLVVSADTIVDDYEETLSTNNPRLLSQPLVVDATVGQAVTFPCDVEDLGDYVIIWKAEKNKILFAMPVKVTRDERFKVVGNTSLHISRVLPNDTGEYTCQLSTSPAVELTHVLNVLYPPTVKPRPASGVVTAKEGERVVLACDVTGNPEPRVTWRHAGSNYASANGKDFVLPGIQKSDSGEYECIADNDVGEPVSAIISVDVVSAPKISAHPASGLVTVKEGEEVKISCEATGDPTPEITWNKPVADKVHHSEDNTKITISEANRNHAGIYECIASNSMGISTSFEIKVEVSYAPEIEVPVQLIHTGEGATVDLICIVQGEPLPSVTWKKGEHVLSTNDHYYLKTMGDRHVLQIRDTSESDFGQYECSARNSLSTATAAIDVVGTPKVPFISSKPHGFQGTRYTLKWEVESHSPIIEYSIRYKKKSEGNNWTGIKVKPNEEEEGHIKTQTHQLIDLEPGVTYEVAVSAQNKFGWSEESENFEFRTKPEVASTMMTKEPTMAAAVIEEGMPDTHGKISVDDEGNGSSSFQVSFLTIVVLCILRPFLL